MGSTMKFYKYTSVVSIVILAALLMPPSSIPKVGMPNVDKLVHFGMFAFLAIVLCGETYLYDKQLPPAYKAMISLSIYAVLTESLQYLSGYRMFDVMDIIADVIGVAFGIALANLIHAKN